MKRTLSEYYLKKELYDLIRQDRSAFEFIQENCLDGTWYWDLRNPENAWMDRKFWSVLGYDSNGKMDSPSSWKNIIFKQDLERIMKKIPQVISNANESLEEVVRFRHKEGHTIWARCRGKTICDKDGIPYRTLCANVDISVFRRAHSVSERICQIVKVGYFIFYNQTGSIELSSMAQSLLQVAGQEKTSWEAVSAIITANKTQDNLLEYLQQIRTSADRIEFDFQINNQSTGLVDMRFISECIETDQSGSPLVIEGTIQDITRTVRFENRLHEQNELLDIFFEQSLTGIFFMMLDEPVEWNDEIDKEEVLDYVFENQRVTKINQAMLDQYGAIESEFMHLTPNDFFAHDIIAGRKVWREFFDKGKLHIDTDERKINGEEMYIEGDYICLYDKDERIIGHFGIQHEVTERKRNENQLREQNVRLENVIKGTNSGTWEWNINTMDVMLNERLYELLGIANNGKKLSFNYLKRLVHPDDFPVAEARLVQCLKNETQHFETELRVKNTGGGWVWLMIHGSVHIRSPKGNPEKMFGSAIDIGDIKNETKRTVRLAKEYKDIFDSSPEGLLVLDTKGTIIRANKAIEHIVGAPRSKIKGAHYSNFLEKDCLPLYFMIKDHLIHKRGEPIKVEISLLRRLKEKTELVPVVISISVAQINERNAKRVVIQISDASHQKQLVERFENTSHILDSMLTNTTFPPFILTDSDGYVVKINSGACQLLSTDPIETKKDMSVCDFLVSPILKQNEKVICFEDLCGQLLHSDGKTSQLNLINEEGVKINVFVTIQELSTQQSSFFLFTVIPSNRLSETMVKIAGKAN